MMSIVKSYFTYQDLLAKRVNISGNQKPGVSSFTWKCFERLQGAKPRGCNYVQINRAINQIVRAISHNKKYCWPKVYIFTPKINQYKL